MKAFSFLLSLLLLFTTGGCARRAAEHPEAVQQPAEIAVAIEKSLPEAAASLLQEFCDNLYQISGKTLRASLQYWEDVSDSQADILFLPCERFFQLAPEMAVLRTDFAFSSYAHFDTAMNAPSTLEEMNRTFSSTGYSIYLTAYGGKRSLVSANGRFVETLRADEAEDIRRLVEEIADGKALEIQPADFSHPPQEDVLYYVDTLQLSGLSEEQTEGYIIINLSYRYHFHLLCLDNRLESRLNKQQMAAVYEAAAILKPACDKAFQALDTQGNRRFSSVILPSQKLQRAILELQADFPHPALESPLYQQIQKYVN